MQLHRLLLPASVAGFCWFLLCALHWHDLRQGHVGAGVCEVLTLERDGGHPRRSVARQTARCACVPGRMAGTTRARPACVSADIVLSRQWCEMRPCLDDEGCQLLVNPSGWTCTQPGGRVKTTTFFECNMDWSCRAGLLTLLATTGLKTPIMHLLETKHRTPSQKSKSLGLPFRIKFASSFFLSKTLEGIQEVQEDML
ncbi:chemokine-like protein TAFA-4 isoform X2 [Vanacampus margaritifer]